MRFVTPALICIGLMIVLGTGTHLVRADGFVVIDEPVPMPFIEPHRPFQRHMPLAVRSHHVTTDIREGVAVTRIDQIFFNASAQTVEGTYIFPLADDIALSRFSMYMDGKEIEGRVLDKETARREYEAIVSRMRDPALLEYVGSRMFKASLFPIRAKGEVQVKLEYAQMLSIDDGLARYRYPLNTERFSSQPIESVSVTVNITQQQGVQSVFSPSHDVAVHRASRTRSSASFEARNVRPDTDFELYYSLIDKPIGLTLLTHRVAGEDGYFLARISPPFPEGERDSTPKDICFVVDTSGSMAGEKMEQAIAALKFCVSNLNPEDRFSVIPFAHESSPWKPSVATATSENVSAARDFIDKLRGSGGTNINDALLAALAARTHDKADRPYLIVFMTDGQPTVGETHEGRMLANVAQANDGSVRLFVFGIGDDVNTRLLDKLAEENHGARDYIGNRENIELKVSSFYRKVSDPVLTDVTLKWGNLVVHDLFPAQLPDLFSGSEIVLVGRYRGAGRQLVSLHGRRRSESVTIHHEKSFPRFNQMNDFLPRLWAIRKVGFLMDQIRQNGESAELKEAIIELATTHGIVTPYTSFLVREEVHTFAEGEFSRRALSRLIATQPARAAAPSPEEIERRMKESSGADAVAQSLESQSMRTQDSARGRTNFAMAGPDGAAPGAMNEPVRQIGRRVLIHSQGQWVQSDIDMDAAREKIVRFSREYFDLAAEDGEIARILALGNQPVFEWRGRIIEVVSEDNG